MPTNPPELDRIKDAIAIEAAWDAYEVACAAADEADAAYEPASAGCCAAPELRVDGDGVTYCLRCGAGEP